MMTNQVTSTVQVPSGAEAMQQSTSSASGKKVSPGGSGFERLLTQRQQMKRTEQEGTAQAVQPQRSETGSASMETAAVAFFAGIMPQARMLSTTLTASAIQTNPTAAQSTPVLDQTTGQSVSPGEGGALSTLFAADTAQAVTTQSQVQTNRPAGAPTASVEESVFPAQSALTSQSTNENSGGETAGFGTSRQSRDTELQVFYSGDSSAGPVFRNVETAPVKVGETLAVDTQSPEMDTRITDQIGTALEHGAQRVEIKLTPENLGPVVIDLTRSQDGTLQVVLHTATEKAASLLTQHSAALSELLHANTQAPVQVQVQRQEETNLYQQQYQDRQGGQNPEQQERRHRQQSEDFLQQLRLGLVPLDEQVS